MASSCWSSILFPFFKPWLAVMGPGMQGRGVIQVGGHIRLHGTPHLPPEAGSRLAYVVRSATGGSVEAVAYLPRSLSDPCYESPPGCPNLVVFSNLAYGQYQVSLEEHTSGYTPAADAPASRHTMAVFGGRHSGTARAEKYPVGAPAVVTIDSAHSRQEITLNFPA
jgi:hypothetical protein